jgi:hypothetical protein
MRKHGFTQRGTPRWRCVRCRSTGIKTRADTTLRHARHRALTWLTGKKNLTDVAAGQHRTRQTISKQLKRIFRTVASWSPPKEISILVLDGIYIHGRLLMALIGLADGGNLVWSFAPKETRDTWDILLKKLPEPQVVVCDGHGGLLASIKALWPNCAIQRCQFHVLKLARTYLTLNPKSIAGMELKNILATLVTRRTKLAAQEFEELIQSWCVQHDSLLTERSHSFDARGKKHWWYTHKKLRGARSLMVNALPNLFTFLDYPECPNTTNAIEGGVNAQLAEGLRLHRGLRLHQKPTLISFLLAKITHTKATRKVT